jgi:hypothetical protein
MLCYYNKTLLIIEAKTKWALPGKPIHLVDKYNKASSRWKNSGVQKQTRQSLGYMSWDQCQYGILYNIYDQSWFLKDQKTDQMNFISRYL